MIRGLRVAVVGATGLVGRSLIGCLEGRRFPVSEAVLFASPASEGRVLHLQGRPCRLGPPTPERAAGFDLAFFCAPGEVAREMAPIFAKGGAVVIDTSGAWSLEPGTPLVVPEINPVEPGFRAGIIASPAAAAVPLALALRAIRGLSRARRATATFSLPVGCRGRRALWDFEDSLRREASKPGPDWDRALGLPGAGAGSENPRVGGEVGRILGDSSLRVDTWEMEVPRFRGVAGNVWVELEDPVPLPDFLAGFHHCPGIRLQGEGVAGGAGEGSVEVGPVRLADGEAPGIRFGVSCDNLLKGSALNAVQIAERVFSV